MFSWLEFGILLLKAANAVLSSISDRKQFEAGRQSAILEEAKKTLALTEEGKRILEKIYAMSDEESDDLLGRLGNSSNSDAGESEGPKS